MVRKYLIYSNNMTHRECVLDTHQDRINAIKNGARYFTTTSFSEDPQNNLNNDKSIVRYGDLFLDFDSQEDISLAQTDALKLVDHLNTLGIPYDALFYFASGNKGFHLQISETLLGSETGDIQLPLIYKGIVLSWKQDLSLSTLDTSIYNMGTGRLLSIPNVARIDKNGKPTGRFKIPLTYEQLRDLSVDEIKSMCGNTQPEICLSDLSQYHGALSALYGKAKDALNMPEVKKTPALIIAKNNHLPPCVEKLLLVTKESGVETNFNDLAMRLACYFKLSGIELENALRIANNFLNNYASNSYPSYEERVGHFKSVFSLVSNDSKYSFGCGSALSVIKKDFSCNSCDTCKPTFEEVADFISQENDIKALEREGVKLIIRADLPKSEEKRLICTLALKLQLDERTVSGLLSDAKKSKNKITNHELAIMFEKYVGEGNYIHTLQGDYLWLGKGIWEKSDKGRITSLIARSMPEKLQNSSLIKQGYELLKDRNRVDNIAFNKNIDSITCSNGEVVYDGGKWSLKDFDRNNYSTIQIPIEFDPKATCPRFEQFLDEIYYFDEDKEDKKQLTLEIIGYSLMKHTKHEKFAILHGDGSNGKSILLETITALHGEENVSAITPTVLDKSFFRSALLNKTANITTELPKGHQIHDAYLKKIVSGELVEAEFKFGNVFLFRPFCTMLFATNNIPSIGDYSNATYRRALFLSFNRKFEKTSEGNEIGNILKTELPGILNISLEAYARIIKTGKFTEPLSMYEAINSWKMSSDTTRQFIDDCCIYDGEYKISSSKLYEMYKEYAKDSSIQAVCTRNNFKTRLLSASDGRVSTGRSNKYIFFQGIKPNSEYTMKYGLAGAVNRNI